jgi:UMF1 family MFS transporter
MYDFANSAFATVVTSATFPLFFQNDLVGDKDRGLQLWGFVFSASMLIVIATAPLIGAITDTTASKKRVLAAFWLAACACTGVLGFFGPGQWLAAGAFFIVANVGFAGGNALYNAFLPELVSRDRMDRVSGIGWGIGYAGGGLCLAIVYFLNVAPSHAMILVGGWWFLFGLPFFLTVRERARPARVEGSKIAYGFRRLMRTFRDVRRFRQLTRFLVAFLLYSNGVETVIIMAAAFGKAVLDMSNDDLILCLLMIQGVALVGSFCFSWFAERIGTKRALILALIIWCGILVWGAMIRSAAEFWVLGAVVGTILGGTQAVSRSLMAKFTPPRLTGEFFGFYAIGGKFAAMLGPAAFGLTALVTGSVRAGVLSLIAFCAIGLVLLVRVDVRKGIEEADAAS